MRDISRIHWNLEVKDFPKAELKPIHIFANKDGPIVSITIQRVFKTPSNYNMGLGPYPCVHKLDLAEALERVL